VLFKSALINIGQLDLYRRHLVLAMVGAVLTHLLLFYSGHLVLSSFSIPSDASRALMLTLDSSLVDGIREDQKDSETINKAEVSVAKSVKQAPIPEDVKPATAARSTNIDQKKVSEQLQVSDTPVVDVDESLLTPAEGSLEEIAEGSLEEIAEDSLLTFAEGSLEEIAEDSLEENAEGSLITPAKGSLVTPAKGSLVTPAEGSLEETRVLTSLESELSIPQLAAAPKSTEVSQSSATETPVTQVSVTKKQQKMLERKIIKFAKQIESGTTAQAVSWEHKGQTYVANFTHFPAADEMEMDKIEVEVATEQDGHKLSKKMKMKKLAFSNFAQFVNQWDQQVTIHDDELDGRFHSNSKILLAPNRKATPLFFGKVTTSSHRVEIDAIGKRTHKKNMFLGGLETGVKKIRMPQPKLLYDDQPLDENSKTYFYEQDTRIVFTIDGRYTAHSLNKSGDTETSTEIIIGNAPIYIYSTAQAKLYVGGTLNGKVLLYSPKGIVIEQSLVYAESDTTEPHDNYLGMVSDRDIVIADAKVTGPGDLQIDASIYAKRQFKVKNYTSKHAGTLRIFGSVSAGTMSATEPRYATNITFDKRLEDSRPPNYPVSDRYELALAEHDWQVEKNEESNEQSNEQSSDTVITPPQ